MQKFKSNPSKTNLTICIGLLIIYYVFKNTLFINMAVIVGLLGLISEKINSLIEKYWFWLAKIMGYIVPNILLGLIFYLILTPISLFYLLFSKGGQVKLKASKSSQFVKVNKNFNPKSFENPW